MTISFRILIENEKKVSFSTSRLHISGFNKNSKKNLYSCLRSTLSCIHTYMREPVGPPLYEQLGRNCYFLGQEAGGDVDELSCCFFRLNWHHLGSQLVLIPSSPPILICHKHLSYYYHLTCWLSLTLMLLVANLTNAK